MRHELHLRNAFLWDGSMSNHVHKARSLSGEIFSTSKTHCCRRPRSTSQTSPLFGSGMVRLLPPSSLKTTFCLIHKVTSSWEENQGSSAAKFQRQNPCST
jgi:hypothetical protein